MPDRNELRTSLFSGNQFKKDTVDVLGADVEIRQPSIKDLQEMGDIADDDKNALVLLMIENCYVPGTNDKLFDKEDYDNLMELPSGKWVQEFQTKYMDLAGLNQDEAVKNSETTD